MFSPNAIMEATLWGTFDDVVETRNRFTLQGDGIDQLTGQQVIDDILEFMESLCALLAALSNAIQVYRGFDVRSQDQTFVSGFVPLAADVPGGIVGNTEPSSLAVLMGFPTTVPKVIGKKMWAGLDDSQVTVRGNLEPVATADWLTDVGGFLIDPYLATHTLWRNGLRTAKTVDFVVFDTVYVRSVFTPMTRRKFGTP